MSFTQCKLRDAVELAYGKSLPARDRKEGEVPVYGSGGIGGYHNEALIRGPGVILGRKGTIGSVFYEKNNFFPIDTVYYIKIDSDKIELRFVYYLLKTLPLKYLNTDAAVPGLNRDIAYDVKINLPDLNTQKEILRNVEIYDDLIENNRRRIQLLEESARLLYKEWFVQLRFPGHEHIKITDGVPDEWEKKPIKEMLTLNYGKALKADNRVPGLFPVYGSSGDVGSHNKPLVEGPAIVVGRKGNVGSIYWVKKDFWPIDTVYFINKGESNLFLYHALQNVTFINTDVAVPGLNRDMAYSREVLIPADNILNLFLDEAEPIQAQIDQLTEYNKKLVEASDILLPRLMNGELLA